MTRKLTPSDFIVPGLLVALSVVPTIGGAARLASVSSGAPANPEDARFLSAPIPIILHVISATIYALFGAFQFSRALRTRWPGVHRRAGRVLAACGLLAGTTGLWMTATYAIPTPMQGPLLYGTRLVVGTAMTASIFIAWRSILRRDVAEHEDFMIRAYALGQGAGTQALVLGPWMVLGGTGVGLTRDLLMLLSWAINAAAAEMIIRARHARARRRANLDLGASLEAQT